MRVLVLLLVAGLVEIGVLVFVGRIIGVLSTLGVLVIGAVLGGWLVRREGRRTLREFSEAARLRRPPPRELSDGVLIAAAGLLILLPGLLSDLAGVVVLLPPVRALLRRRMRRAAERRSAALREQVRQAQAAQGEPFTTHTKNTEGDVIEGEVVSVAEEDDGDSEPDPNRTLPKQDSEQVKSSSERRGSDSES